MIMFCVRTGNNPEYDPCEGQTCEIERISYNGENCLTCNLPVVWAPENENLYFEDE